MASAVIRTQNLTKHFGRTVALEDLTLEVAAGEIFGFLGPNGAGKSTTIRLLLGLIGLWLAAVGKSLKGNLVPVNDPKLGECLAFENY